METLERCLGFSALGCPMSVVGGEHGGEFQNALEYVKKIKRVFADRPDVYTDFLTTLKEFKEGHIDAPAVVHRIHILFAGHPDLVHGFSTFLPPDLQTPDANHSQPKHDDPPLDPNRQ